MAPHVRNPFAARIALVVALDLACLFAAAFAARHWATPPVSLAAFAAAIGVVAIGVALVLQMTGGYDLDTIGSGPKTCASLLSSIGIGFAAAFAVCVFAPSLLSGSKDSLLRAAALFLPLLVLERKAFRSLSKRVRKRVVLVGASDLALALARCIERRSDLGLEIVGMLGADAEDGSRAEVDGIPILGPLDHLEKVIRDDLADWVVATSQRDESLPADQLLSLRLRGVPIFSGLSLYERISGEVYHQGLRWSALVFDERLGMRGFESAVKRVFDVVFASLALVFSSPILLAAAIAIRLDSKGPVFFRQTRVGRFHEPFGIVKLRTMVDDAEKVSGAVFASRGDPRITRVGRILRRTHIDELPQFWNVLKGEMSVVGPRPERPELLDEISERFPYFRVRSACKPGVTGWAQVRHGYVADIEGFEKKLALDLYYMRNWRLGLDLSIVWTTMCTMLSLRGV